MEDQPLEELSESECWTLLRTVDIGRLAAPTARGGVEIFPVNHVVDQASIVFRTAMGTKLTTALDALEVAFEADNAASAYDQQHDDPWSVVIHGTADLISLDTQLFDTFELAVHPWHLSNKPYFVRLVPTVVSGRRFRIDRGA
ncbi:MAG TPA: pyridoxamine 5'-phosphate oxidase family protein [Ilumatobacteraceae bacterium]|nr:pyridoxamine 5'-phosphate oxidase family protein [Ilumatobacteraceae bacterium]